MINENEFFVVNIIQYILLIIFIFFLYLRKKYLLREENFIENLLIFFIIGSGFKIYGLSIYDEIFSILLCYIIIFIFKNLKENNYKNFLKQNIFVIFILSYLTFKLFENVDKDNLIFFFRFLVIYLSLFLFTFYFWNRKIKFIIDYKTILNCGIFYFSLYLILSYLIDISFINHKIDLSLVWNNFRTYQLDKFVFQNIFWQGISSSNIALIPFVLFFVLKKNLLNIKEVIFLSLVSVTAIYWHSMQLIFMVLMLNLILIIKNYKNLKFVFFSYLISFFVLLIISTSLVKPENKNLNLVDRNKVNFKHYSNQFENLFQIFGNLFSYNKNNKSEFRNLQSYAVIDSTDDEFYFIRFNKKITIKNISLQDKIVPILLSLKKSRKFNSVIFGEGFRSYRDTVPRLWSNNLDYFQYKSKEDEFVKNYELKKDLKSETNKILPFSECNLNENTGLYNCNSYLNYSEYKSPTTLIASIYDYGYFFVVLIILFCVFNTIIHKSKFTNLIIIYIYLFLFAFTCDLTDSFIFYFFIIFTPYLINNEKTFFKHLS